MYVCDSDTHVVLACAEILTPRLLVRLTLLGSAALIGLSAGITGVRSDRAEPVHRSGCHRRNGAAPLRAVAGRTDHDHQPELRAIDRRECTVNRGHRELNPGIALF